MTDSLSRFELRERLGAGGQGHTILARDTETGADVVVKELDLSRVESAKAIELFEREARVLERLDHPCIPAYVTSFTEQGADGGVRYYLVQEFVSGPTLEQEIARGHRWTQAEVEGLTRQLLEILVYLQRQEPPVIHRDIKPANILVRDDGSLALVDFGAAQVVSRETFADSTIIGTSGYMAPEQFTGRAVPSSDLYGVGMTMLHVLSHRHPEEIPMTGLTIEFRPLIRVSDDFATYLDRLVAPVLEDRFPTAVEALALLDDLDTIAQYQPPPDHTMMTRVGPRGSKVTLRRTKGALELVLPSAERPMMAATWLLVWLIVLGALVPFLIFKPLSLLQQTWALMAVLITLFIGSAREFRRFVQWTVQIDESGVRATRNMPGRAPRTFDLALDEVSIEVVPVEAILGSTRRPHEIVFETDDQKVELGQYLSPPERTWILDELRATIRSLQADRAETSDVVFDTVEREDTSAAEAAVPEHVDAG